MTADISTLANLQSAEPLDWENYPDAQEVAPPPPKGRYILRAPESITFSATREGYLSAQIDPTVVGPTGAGYLVKFSRISAKPFKRGGRTVSQMGDYLRACGITARPGTPQELADAVASTVGRTYTADLDWECYDKVSAFQLKGQENFPSDGAGGNTPFVRCPIVAEGEEARMLRANARISRFVTAS